MQVSSLQPNLHQKHAYPTLQLVEFRQKILLFHKYFLVRVLTHHQAFFQTRDVLFLISISFLEQLLHHHHQCHQHIGNVSHIKENLQDG